MYSFYVPNGIKKNFQKKKEIQEKIRITFFLVTSMYSFLCPKWDRENKNNIPFFHPKKVEKKNTRFFYSLSHIFAKPLYTALSHGLYEMLAR